MLPAKPHDGRIDMIRTMIAMSAMVAAAALSPAVPADAAVTGPSTAPPAAASEATRTAASAAPGHAGTAASSGPHPGGAAAQQQKRTELTLSYTADAGYAAAVKLSCDPAGGAHPKPAEACGELKQAGGRPDRIQPARTMCMLIYAPVTAQITGRWKGKKVNWSKTYGNSCEMSRATGVLFRF